jgi:glycine C-acetyltransferase
MTKINFLNLLQKETGRIDNAKTAKRNEKIIEGFTRDPSPQAVISGKAYRIFNSNDYLGLRLNKKLATAERQASEKFGVGPGAVRFISGSLRVYKDLEKILARFHEREEAMVFSSAFAANVGVIHSLIKGQSKDSLISQEALVLSDALNHRSIIEGIRVANLPKEQRLVYEHLNYENLDGILNSNAAKFKRVIVITDGIFSMLGEAADLKKLKAVIDKYDKRYEQGIISIVDDSHGVGVYGETGRGVEEIGQVQADVLIGTLGKAFGSDGGYAVANKKITDYLRESAATYIYSNSISPGVAGAALSAVELVMSEEGKSLLKKLKDNILLFKKMLIQAGFNLAADSIHPIQPILIGDPAKTKALTEELFRRGILVTSINYPVVPAGRDEIRVQINASHTKKDLEYFIAQLMEYQRSLG